MATYKELLQHIKKKTSGSWMKTCWIKEIKDKEIQKEEINDKNNK